MMAELGEHKVWKDASTPPLRYPWKTGLWLGGRATFLGNISRKEKGKGKFYRKGNLGGRREDFTSDQVTIVEGTTAPLLKESYPQRDCAGRSARSSCYGS